MTSVDPVILLHSAGRTPQMWQDQVEAIAGIEGISVLAPWLAGLRPGKHAELSLAGAADELLTTLDRHGIFTAQLVGHQLGAMVALQVAQREPDLTSGLVLSGAMLTPSAMALRVQRTLIRLLPNKSLAESGATKADLLRALDLIATADFSAGLHRITAPVLVLAGSADPARAAARQLAEALPKGRYLELSGAGANPNLEAPSEYNQLLVEFLSSAK